MGRVSITGLSQGTPTSVRLISSKKVNRLAEQLMKKILPLFVRDLLPDLVDPFLELLFGSYALLSLKCTPF